MERAALPELVSRYVRSALPEPVPGGGKVRVTQEGQMVRGPGGRSLRFEAIEEFAIDRVAFTWRARFPLFGPIALRVTDSYEPPDGLLEVRLFGLPVQRQRGADLAVGEAFRYLAEIAWAPHAIVANRQLAWKPLDERTVEVSTEVAGQRIAVRVGFDSDEIVQISADRPRRETEGKITHWVGEFRDYASFSGIRMPARGEVRWETDKGPFTYWRGAITSAELVDSGRPGFTR